MPESKMFDKCLGCLGLKSPKKFEKDKKGKSAWRRWTARKRNAENFSERIINVGQKASTILPNKDVDDDTADESQIQFVGNDIKTSKYTFLTFIPRNLFEQFRRIANVYFAVIGFIQLFIDSPVSPFTSISPLVFVIVVTMVKQGYEDVLRHRADNGINKKLVTKVEASGIVQIQSKNVQVGDILCVEDDDELPCDLLLLSTSNPKGKASVLTANLDGETNLKIFSATTATRSHRRPHELSNLRAVVECENPNPDLGRFVGRLKVLDQDGRVSVYPLGPENIVWRGTRLKNTDFVYGCAIYTGRDTKMSQNSKLKSNKFSSIEVMLNKYLLFYLFLLIFEVTVATTLRFVTGVDKPGSADDGTVPWYLYEDVDANAKQIAQDTLSFLVLFNYIIPISLYVTLELQKFFGSLFLTWDLDLYDASTDTPAKCNTSDLNEELGNVEFLFSDKTGTLTENVMIFRECSIDGVLFFDQSDNLVSQASPSDRLKRSVRRFLEVLSLCHTVQAVQKIILDENRPSGNPYDLMYHASSPDEKAIVEACRNYGVAFMGERENEYGIVQYRLLLSLSSKTQKITVERLHVLEFDSNRKCMSVMIRDSKGQVRLLTKGAESSIIPKCANARTDPRFVSKVGSHIDTFASRGLRTLAVATRTLTEKEYQDFLKRLTKAEKALDRREDKLRQVYESAETNLELIGAIGIEDRLQEGVKETLVALGGAGIKIWILTGDKKETAINISSSCGHYRPNMQLLDIAGLKSPQVVERVLSETLEKRKLNNQRQACLVVDGVTISTTFNEKNLTSIFLELTKFCESVICCRMSPLQKAEVVRLIKETGAVTAAIGDGANDVSMIQEADVGLGIAGREGRAAVRASDFAFAKFRFLKKVLLVHGHWYYYRAAILVQYFFYKNVAGFTAQFFYAFFNSASSQTLYDGVNLTLYNITFTSLPIFLFGLLEQNIKADDLLANPSLYKNISKNKLLSPVQGLLWFLEALWHAVVTFFSFYLLWTYNLNSIPGEFTTMEMYSFGLAIYQCVLVVVSLRIIVQSRFWNILLIGGVIASLLFFLVFTLTYHGILVAPTLANFFYDQPIQEGNFPADKMPLSLDLYWVIFYLLKCPSVWLTTAVVIVICLLPYLVIESIRNSGLVQRIEKSRRDSLEMQTEFDNFGFDADGSIVNIRL